METREVIPVMSLMGEGIDAYLLLKKALKACKNKLVVYVNEGHWYNFPGRALGLDSFIFHCINCKMLFW